MLEEFLGSVRMREDPIVVAFLQLKQKCIKTQSQIHHLALYGSKGKLLPTRSTRGFHLRGGNVENSSLIYSRFHRFRK